MPYYQIEYNGFSLPYVRSTVTETPVYADDQITLEGTQYDLKFSGYLAGATDTASFATMLSDMRCALSSPRQDLLVQWSDDNSTWNTLYDFDQTTDNAFGPFPGTLEINKVYGGRACLYSWSVRVFQKTCFGNSCIASISNNEVLSIVRRYDYDIDQNGLTTRRVSGTLTIRSNNVNSGTPVDNYRWVCTPSIPINFQRTGEHFSQSEDGRKLSFTFTDAEVKYTFPSPITDGNASFTAQVEYSGLKVNFSLTGRFSAPSDQPKSTILTAIFNLINAKFPASLSSQATFVWTAREFTDDIYNNAIAFNITGFYAAGVTATGTPNFNLGLDTFVVSPPGSNGQSTAILPYGSDQSSSGVISPPPGVYDNCTSPANQYAGTGQPYNALPLLGSSNYGGSGSPPSSTGPGTTGQGSGISSSHQTNPWVAYHERFSWEIDNNIIAFCPKVKGQAPILQQTAMPSVTFIQAGYAQQMGSSPTLINPPTAPFYQGTSNAVMQNCYVSPAVPDGIGDGSVNRYTIHWRYVMRLAVTVNSVTDIPQLAYPSDPRRPSGPANSIDLSGQDALGDNFLDLVETPG